MQKISLQVDAGEILAVVGQSGSGKTTLLHMIAGLTQPDSGSVLLNDHKVEGPEQKLVPGHPEIRLVHQNSKLHHQMTVEENLRNALLEYAEDYQNSRIDELLNLCRISPTRDQLIHHISGGEKQRLAIAMALSTEPEVLLFDEPFSQLDLTSKSILLQEISSLAKDTGTSILLVTHDSRDAMEIADRMLVIKEGHLQVEGTPSQLYGSPKNKYVAGLMGLYNIIPFRNLEVWGQKPKSNRDLGIWAEDLQISKWSFPNAVEGVVLKVIFTGPFYKVLIKIKDTPLELWAISFDRSLQLDHRIYVSIPYPKLFELRE